MTEQLPEEPCHFKNGFDPKCPKDGCGSTNIKVSLSEDLYGPCNGRYEVIYCGDCHTFLGAHPVVISNLFKGLPKEHEINYD